MGLWCTTLMVTEDGNHSVGFVVRVEFLLDGAVVRSLLVELNLESLRSVEGTEDFRGKPLHVPVEVSVQLGGLSDAGGGGQVPAAREGANEDARGHDRVEHHHPSCFA